MSSTEHWHKALNHAKDRFLEHVESVSKTTTTLSLSVLVLSFAFVDQFTPEREAAWLLVSFWLAMVLTVILNAITWFSLSKAADGAMAYVRRELFTATGDIALFRRRLEQHDSTPCLDADVAAEMRRQLEIFDKSEDAVEQSATWTSTAFALHRWAILIFVLGFILLTSYAGCNLL